MTTDAVAGVRLDPPAPRAVAAPPPASCGGADLVCGNGDGTVLLARATAQAAGVQGADGSLAPLFRDQLVYVMTWHHTSCPGGGGMPVFSDPGSTMSTGRVVVTPGHDRGPGTATTYVDAMHPNRLLFAACG